jgi:hypothetical protein
MISNGYPYLNPELDVGAEGWLDADPDQVKINGRGMWYAKHIAPDRKVKPCIRKYR